MIRVLILLSLLVLCSCVSNVQSTDKDAQAIADSAVANILFDYDGSSEFASYTINESGFVDIIFAKDMPDNLYGEILTKLQNTKEISGVLSSKSGPICGLF